MEFLLHRNKKGTCMASCSTEKIAQGSATGYKDVFTDSARVLMMAVAQQPVSIAIEADQSSFQSCFAVGRTGRREVLE